MALSAAGSALVAGSFQENDMQAQQQQPQIRSARVLRPFYFNGKPTKVGETIELPRIFALEMKAAHKVELIEVKTQDKPQHEKEKVEARPGQKALV
jgi:hypothetical protein